MKLNIKLPAALLVAVSPVLTSMASDATSDDRAPADAASAPPANPWSLYRDGKFEDAMTAFATATATKPDKQWSSELKRLALLEFGQGAAAFKAKDFDTAIQSFGKALVSPDKDLRSQAQYNLANALAGKAQAIPKGKGRLKSMIGLLEDALPHYDQSLQLDPKFSDAQSNRDAVKKFIDDLKKYQEAMKQKAKDKKKDKGQEGKDKKDGKQGQKGEKGQEGQGDQGQQGDDGEGDDEGDDGDEDGDGQGDGDKDAQGQQKGSEPGQGDEKDGDKGGGKKPDDQKQAAPGDNEQQRKGEQKSEGKLEAKNGGEGQNGDKKDGESKKTGGNADSKRDKMTGFSRTEARALLKMLSDEDWVRPLTDKAAPEGSFKNW